MPHPSAQRGFTLLEMIVVIIILGLLTAGAAPTWRAITARAGHTVLEAELVAFNRQASALRALGDTWPTAVERTAGDVTNGRVVVQTPAGADPEPGRIGWHVDEHDDTLHTVIVDSGQTCRAHNTGPTITTSCTTGDGHAPTPPTTAPDPTPPTTEPGPDTEPDPTPGTTGEVQSWWNGPGQWVAGGTVTIYGPDHQPLTGHSTHLHYRLSVIADDGTTVWSAEQTGYMNETTGTVTLQGAWNNAQPGNGPVIAEVRYEILRVSRAGLPDDPSDQRRPTLIAVIPT